MSAEELFKMLIDEYIIYQDSCSGTWQVGVVEWYTFGEPLASTLTSLAQGGTDREPSIDSDQDNSTNPGSVGP